MAVDIDQAFIEDFESRVHQKGQQEISRVRPYIRNRSGTGDIYNFEVLDPSPMAARSGLVATPVNGIVHSRRKAQVNTFEWGELVEQSDIVRIIIDPDSEYVKAASMAYGRQIDQSILANALDGTTLDGAGASIGVLGAGQIVGDGTGAMSLDFLRSAKRKLDEAEVMGNRCIALRSNALEDLMKVTEVASSDYNTVKALVQGEINTFLGFEFKRTELTPGSAAANVVGISAVCWVEDALAIAFSDDKFTRIGPDASARWSNRIYMETSFGNARVEDAGVVMIDTLPS